MVVVVVALLLRQPSALWLPSGSGVSAAETPPDVRIQGRWGFCTKEMAYRIEQTWSHHLFSAALLSMQGRQGLSAPGHHVEVEAPGHELVAAERALPGDAGRGPRVAVQVRLARVDLAGGRGRLSRCRGTKEMMQPLYNLPCVSSLWRLGRR